MSSNSLRGTLHIVVFVCCVLPHMAYLWLVTMQIMSGDSGEDPQIHGCKLLEVMVLQCQGRIDTVSLYTTSG